MRRLSIDRGDALQTLTFLGLDVFPLERGKVAAVTVSGDLQMLRCSLCGYADERDLARARKDPPVMEAALMLKRVPTPDCSTIEGLAAFLGIGKERTAKAMMYTRRSDGAFIFAALRGDMQISQRKLERSVGDLQPAAAAEILAAGAVPGYASPIGLKNAIVVVDDLVAQTPNLAVGANEEGFHCLNANFGRDFQAGRVEDIALARAGEPCWRCGLPLIAVQGILVADDTGYQEQNALLALAECCMDEHGLHWPKAVAPFDVYLVQLSSKEIDTRPACEMLCASLEAAGMNVLYDDREARAGVKFNDADLIGCPIRVTVGAKGLRAGMIEFKLRDNTESQTMELSRATDAIRALLGDSNA